MRQVASTGRLKVMLRDGKKGQTGGQARISAILYVELLGQMIGVNLRPPELPYC